MDESEFDFEFDFLHEHPPADAEHDEQALWEESDEAQPVRRRPAPAPPSAQVVKRRRIAAGAALALVLLIILIVVATSGGGGGSGGTYSSYLSQVSGIAADSQSAGASLGSLSGKTAVSKLDSLIQQTTDDINRMQALTPPETLASQQGQALAALDLRLLGLQQLRSAFAQASGGTPDTGVATLVASDRIWENAARTPANAVLQARGLGGVYPSSTFVAGPAALTKSLGTLLGTSATSPTGAVLKLGDTGQDVVAWQNALNQWIKASGSTLTQLNADGNFGAGTQAATVALQNAAGLAPDGVVGPTTRQALQQQLKTSKSSSTGGTTAGSAPTLKLGDTGQDVVDWQTKLDQWLQATAPSQSQIATDGSFGQGTLQATEQLQTSAGLTPTGQVDAATRQALASALASSSPNRG
jgi:peptidoglycan hydrolase-like protein with peptidoglycan-binding domain